jgi:hypothetical protein
MLSRRTLLLGLLGAAAVPLLPPPGRLAATYGLAWSSYETEPAAYERWTFERMAGIYHRILVDGREFHQASYFALDGEWAIVRRHVFDDDGVHRIPRVVGNEIVEETLYLDRYRCAMILESAETGARLRTYS